MKKNYLLQIRILLYIWIKNTRFYSKKIFMPLLFKYLIYLSFYKGIMYKHLLILEFLRKCKKINFFFFFAD